MISMDTSYQMNVEPTNLLVGMFSYMKSQITIFGHVHIIKTFIKMLLKKIQRPSILESNPDKK